MQAPFLRAWNRAEQLRDDYCRWALVNDDRGGIAPRIIWKSSRRIFPLKWPSRMRIFPAVTIDFDALFPTAPVISKNLSRASRKSVARNSAFFLRRPFSQCAIAERRSSRWAPKGWARTALSRLCGKIEPRLVDFCNRRSTQFFILPARILGPLGGRTPTDRFGR